MFDFKEIDPCEITLPKRRINRVFIHCTASDADTSEYYGVNLSETIHRWHKSNEWLGIGYNYVIDKRGILVTARDVERTPAAQSGNNMNTIAVCLHGLDKDKFTVEQKRALKHFCKHINSLYKGNITFHGHCEVSPKTCPVINYKKLLLLDDKGKLGI